MGPDGIWGQTLGRHQVIADAGLRLIRRATAATRMRRPRSRRHELMAQLNVSHRLAKKRVLPPHLFRAIFFSRASCGIPGYCRDSGREPKRTNRCHSTD